MSDMMVSVYCTAYNHARYIRSALEGFVSQQTDFKFEVFVHDDASTDETADIIREYATRYPEIIRPIYQTENQFSKGVRYTRVFIFPLMTGKYIAACEGDDYWCDPHKLQRQVDFLEQNPAYSACVHNTKFVYPDHRGEKIRYPEMDMDIGLEQVIPCGGAAYQTSSLMYRADYLMDRPAFVSAVRGVGDYPLSIFLALHGKIRYLSDVMSVYRCFTTGSWSEKNTGERLVPVYQDIIAMLESANEYSGFQYHNLFQQAITHSKYLLCLYRRDYRGLTKGDGRPFYKEKGRWYKIKLWIQFRLPVLYALIRKIKG